MIVWLYLLAGCASKRSFEKVMSVFVGKPISYVEGLAGFPNRKDTLENGHHVYLYNLPEYKDCTVFYEVNNLGFVHKWWHEGVCPSN